MKELTDFGSQKMYMHMRGKASFRDVMRYREMLRKRRFFYLLDAVIVVGLIVGIFLVYMKNYLLGGIFIAVAVLIIFYFIKRRKPRRKHRRKRN